MATIKPFAALRPKPELAARICELPYDVVSTEEARQIASDNLLSFFHVSKPEIDLAPATDPYAPEVYARGRESFQRLIAQGALVRDARPSFYLYRQGMGGHTQVGLVAAASCEDYLQGIIKKHELTRPDKEDDRVRHIVALGAQTGPVFLVYRASQGIDALVATKLAGAPDIDFTAPDGVRHSAWVVGDAPSIQTIQNEFARIPCLYIADGHHRCAAAARVYQGRKAEPGAALGEDESAFFLSVIFPHNQVQILPYNRVVKDLNGLSPQQLLVKLDGVFVRQRSPSGSRRAPPDIQAQPPAQAGKHKLDLYLARRGGDTAPYLPGPASKHELGFYLGGQWHTLRFRPQLAAGTDPVEQLDVTLLQRHVLGPIFGIDDPRTSTRLHFVGGIRGAAELEKLVNGGQYDCAFSLFPTRIEDLLAVADAGGLMPPKSTWFEPKLRDALFCHRI